jgi:hypothetical protein
MGWIIRLAILLCAVWMLPCIAKAQESQPTDTDLRAAYCLGADADWMAFLQQTFEEDVKTWTGTPEKLAQLTAAQNAASASLQHDMNRLRGYLLARGYFTPNSVFQTLGIQIPLNQGKQDATDCRSHLTGTCFLDCLNKPDVEACQSVCPQPESCRHVRLCLTNLSFLPY